MREIKFRGKPIQGKLPNGEVLTGDFIYGHLVITSTEYHILSPDGKVFKNYNVAPETVGQFTGLQDSDGVDVYEGDILKNEWGIHVVQYRKGEFEAYQDDMGKCWDGYMPLYRVCNEFRTCHIVGNIHDQKLEDFK